MGRANSILSASMHDDVDDRALSGRSFLADIFLSLFFFLMTIRMSVISLPRYGLTGRMVECDNRRATLADGRLHHGGSVPSGQVVHPNPNFVSTS